MVMVAKSNGGGCEIGGGCGQPYHSSRTVVVVEGLLRISLLHKRPMKVSLAQWRWEWWLRNLQDSENSGMKASLITPLPLPFQKT